MTAGIGGRVGGRVSAKLDDKAALWAARVRAEQPDAPPPPARNVERASTRDQQRSRRKRDIKSTTINIRRLSQRELEHDRELYPETDHDRPRSREECADGPRPCPYVSCAHHLYLDVNRKNGSIKLNFQDLEVWELTESCARDLAARGGGTLEEVGAAMNITRERVRQLEAKAFAKVRRKAPELRDFLEGDGRRRLPVLQGDGQGNGQGHGHDESDGEDEEDREDEDDDADDDATGDGNDGSEAEESDSE